MKTFLALDPWDLFGPDASALLDRFSGELGATGVAVSLGLPEATRLRSPGYDPRVVQTRGGLFFHAGDDGFEATRLKPIASSSAPRRDWLAEACAGCHDRGLTLRGALSLSRLGRVAQKHRDMGCRNVFGATSRDGVCLVNPDVQAFFAALLSVMSERYAFDAITLADPFFGWTEATARHALTPVPLSPADHALLSICFCESCLQRAGEAGIDALAARHRVGTILDAALGRSVSSGHTMRSVLSENPPLQAYVMWRGQAMSVLWARLSEACACDLVVDVSAGCGGAIEGVAATQIADAVRSTFGERDYNAVAGVMSGAMTGIRSPKSTPNATPQRQAGEAPCDAGQNATANRHEWRIPASLCIGDHGPQLVTMMAQASESGIETVQIDGAASLPHAAMDSVRQAIRFARRTA